MWLLGRLGGIKLNPMDHHYRGEYRRRSSVVVVNEDKLLVFDAIDPTSGAHYVFLPGGKIEEGEDAAAAAERETFEETGYKIRVHRQSAIEIHYPFTWNGKLYHSHTLFFRGTLIDSAAAPSRVDDAEYNKGALWIRLEEIQARFDYSSEIRKAVLALANSKI
jgi:8-oxo-dGTP pyrophosphatase MutT (NUDIX family)